MQFKNFIMFLTLVPIVALSGNPPQKAVSVRSFSVPVSRWLMSSSPLPLINGRIKGVEEIKASSPDLIFKAETGQYFFIVQPHRNRIDYILTEKRGIRRASIYLSWNIDLPVPKPLLNKVDRQIYLIDIGGKMTAYNFKGQRLWQKSLVEDYIFTYENTYFAAMAHNRLMVVLSYPRSGRLAGFKTMYVILNNKGRILKRVPLAEMQALQAAFSPDGKYLALMLHNATVPGLAPRSMIFDNMGSKVWQKDIGFRKIIFLNDSNFVVQQKQQVLSFSLQAVKSRWVQKVADKNFIFDDIIFDGAKTIGIIQGKAGYKSGRLFYTRARVSLFHSKDGNLRDQIDLGDRRYLPSAFRFAGNHRVLVGCETALLSIQYQEENSDEN